MKIGKNNIKPAALCCIYSTLFWLIYEVGTISRLENWGPESHTISGRVGSPGNDTRAHRLIHCIDLWSLKIKRPCHFDHRREKQHEATYVRLKRHKLTHMEQNIKEAGLWEKREPSYTVGGNVNWCSHCGTRFLKKLKIELPCVCMCVLSHFGHVWLCNPMDYSPPGSSSMEFSRQEYLSELPCPAPGIFPTQGSNSQSLSPALGGRFFTTSIIWETLELSNLWPSNSTPGYRSEKYNITN